MFRRIFLPFLLTCIINSDLMMSSQVSLGRLFPASRNRQRASSLISHAIESSFYKRPSFQPPKTKSKGTIKSLPSFPDVLWKFNKRLINNNVLKIQNQSENSSSTEAPDLAEHFSKFNNFAAAMTKTGTSKLKGPRPPLLDNEVMAESQRNEVRQKINKINEEEMKNKKTFSTRAKSTPPPVDSNKNKEENKFAGVTNSPIFYIQLPAAPYEFHPSLGYISRPASPDLSGFLRPQIDFLNNGRPTNIFQPATPISILNETEVLLDVTTASTMPSTSSLITELTEISEYITVPIVEIVTTTEPSTSSSTTPTSTTSSSISVSTPSSEANTTSTSTSRPTVMSSTTDSMPTSSSTSSTTSKSIVVESSTSSDSSTLSTPDTTTENVTITTTTTTTKLPTTIKGGYTNSPITWLKGPYVFNGRPNNIFIYKSPPNKADRFDYLHKLYSKPGVYL